MDESQSFSGVGDAHSIHFQATKQEQQSQHHLVDQTVLTADFDENHHNASSSSSSEAQHETSASVSSSIMLKVPTYNLNALRADFEEEEDGLDMEQFLHAFTKNMVLESDTELLNIVPDLIDFFNLVDINGDASMQWTEFVM
jgi:hypothetical protein